ncbi:MAG: helix-turn-helix transcriptional regulator [Pseudomonadota bacterium]
MSLRLDPEEALVQDIYAAAYDPALWVGVMERLSDAVGGLRGCLTRIDTATGAGVDAILFRSDPTWVDAYAEHFGSCNVFHATNGATPAGHEWRPAVLTDEDCVSREDYGASEYYNDFMRPQDVDRALFIRLGRSGTVASTINIGRRTGEAFEQADLAFAARLQPHMIRAYEIGRRLAANLDVTRSLSARLEQSAHALFLVEADGGLQFANPAAEHLLRRGCGLTVINRRLTPLRPDAARQFELLVGRAANRGAGRRGGTMALEPPSGGPAMILRTAPLPLDLGPVYRAAAPVLVSVTDLEIDVPPPSAELSDLFGLTPAEVRLAAAMFEGQTLAEAAEDFGLSINTVRYQLARIFDKTGVSRQAELVKLMMRLASTA